MNDLDLPPRRTMPPEVRHRVRMRMDQSADTPSRNRKPLAVAAAVAVLAAGAVMVTQSAAPDDSNSRAGQSNPTDTSASGPARTSAGEKPLTTPDEDLDNCAHVVAASPLAGAYPPRNTWVYKSVFGLSEYEIGIVMFEAAGHTMFCVLDDGTATVSPPTNPRVTFVSTDTQAVYGVYMFPDGIIVGVAENLDGVSLEYVIEGTSLGPMPPIHRGVFFAGPFPDLHDGDQVQMNGRDAAGNLVVTGEWTYDPAQLHEQGASGHY
ncbi:hypothetical protein [Actinophytocola oryzae]|uniref:Uncharacterized protein n=1 Tax=Actinophytocola oryzae TaxID=502181 RepID=A0A4R7VIR4_9PSEU|nr:hypothetical protein [Actinophytocola oryzae]TDV48998.1 hypothetical protein CLV71_108359 [Actinophytocola oryzae]